MLTLNYSFTRGLDKRLYGEDVCELNDGSYCLLHVDHAEETSLDEGRYGKIFSYVDGNMESKVLSTGKPHDGSVDIYLPKNGVYSYPCQSAFVSLSEADDLGETRLLQESMPLSGHIDNKYSLFFNLFPLFVAL